MKNTPVCRRCNVPMKDGTVLVNGCSGLSDLCGTAQTLHPDPSKVTMTSCWKCPSCGRSLIKKTESVKVKDRPALSDRASKKWWRSPLTPRDLIGL